MARISTCFSWVNLVGKRLLLRVMFYQTPLGREGRPVLPTNSFDSYLYLGATELDLELCKHRNPLPALSRVLSDIRCFITFSTFMTKRIVWDNVNECLIDVSKQPFEVIYAMRNGPKSDRFQDFSLCFSTLPPFGKAS